MKVLAFSLPVLMLVAILGCTEQSQLAGPTSPSTPSASTLAKSTEPIPVDMYVTDPDGIVFRVTGTVQYSLAFDPQFCWLATKTDLTLTNADAGEGWHAVNEEKHMIDMSVSGWEKVSEEYIATKAADVVTRYRVGVYYEVGPGGITIADIKVYGTSVRAGNALNGGIGSTAVVLPVDTKVFDAQGRKYHITGSVNYDLGYKDQTCSVITTANLVVEHVGPGTLWNVIEEKSYRSDTTSAGWNQLTEDYISTPQHSAVRRCHISIDYAIALDEVRITNVGVYTSLNIATENQGIN